MILCLSSNVDIPILLRSSWVISVRISISMFSHSNHTSRGERGGISQYTIFYDGGMGVRSIITYDDDSGGGKIQNAI